MSYNYPCAGIIKQSMGARKRVGIGLSYRPGQATQPGGIGFLKSILGLLKSFKNSGSERSYVKRPIYIHVRAVPILLVLLLSPSLRRRYHRDLRFVHPILKIILRQEMKKWLARTLTVLNFNGQVVKGI
jgi:hypothetical protein